MAKETKCCGGANPFLGLIGSALVVLGIYFLVWGFINQTNNMISWSTWNWNAGLLYFIGVMVFGAGKMMRHRYCWIEKMMQESCNRPSKK